MRTNEELFRLSAERNQAQDWRGYCELFHQTDSVYFDPFFGELHGREKIRDWFLSVMEGSKGVAFDPIFQPTLSGDIVVVESLMKAVSPDGTTTALTRFCHVERYRSGWIAYAADYYDTHPVRRQLARVSEQVGFSQPR